MPHDVIPDRTHLNEPRQKNNWNNHGLGKKIEIDMFITRPGDSPDGQADNQDDHI
jgi:hypothetical protein